MSFLNDVQDRYSRLGARGAFFERAWAQYSRQGLPDRKNEFWKYSNLNQLVGSKWSEPAPGAAVSAKAREWRDAWKAQFDILVVVNGELRADESVISTKLGSCLNSSANAGVEFDDGFASLAAALSRPAVRLSVPRGVGDLRPVMILQSCTGEGSWTASLNEISVGENAELNLVQVHFGDGAYLRTETARATIAEGGRLNWLRVQRETFAASHYADVAMNLAAHANVTLTQVNAGAAWSRGVLRADVRGEGAEAHIQGLSFGSERQHIDQRVVVNHFAGNTASSQLFKGVLGGHSRGVLNGKIYIARDAQKVASSQLNHNMLTSSTAEADTKPELEIYADDVKANHGASVGRLDDEKLFYLESRGIPRAVAERMLVEAFVFDVLMKIPGQAPRALMNSWVKELQP